MAPLLPGVGETVVMIEFTRNDRPTVGVELELYLVDPVTGDLVDASNTVIDELAAGRPAGGHPKVKHELYQSTIELITGVCDTAGEAGLDLRSTLDEVRAVTDRHRVALMSSGTHPFAKARDQVVTDDDRYRSLIEAMQWPARRLLTCGLHVHVGVPDGRAAIAVLNELKRHLPVFLALSSSSPYFEGEDSGLASARAKVFEGLPTAGLPPELRDWDDFETFMSTLLESACIDSIREVWWDIRPHPDFGTVELRMCDAPPTLWETVALAALAQTLVTWCLDRLAAGELPDPPREWTVRENRWLAGRYGTDAELIVTDPATGRPRRRPVVTLVDELLDALQPTARRLGTDVELAMVRHIVRAGSGTHRQRRWIEAGDTLRDVVANLSSELLADPPVVP